MNEHHKIKLFVMDVDGTLTDGKVYIGKDGELMKSFSIKDGYGVRNILIPSGVRPVVITGRKSEILEYRCTELDISEVYQNIKDKLIVLEQVAQKYDVSFSEIAYIGDDLNDMPCMIKIIKHGGIVGCPADAAAEVKEISTYASSKNGGEGAVRDFINFICRC